MTTYLGIDFANITTNVGRCYLDVDAATRQVTPQLQGQEPTEVACTAVDCPFGTTEGFQKLLVGTIPQDCPWDQGFKTRATENWLRGQLWSYQTNQFWRRLAGTSPQHYVNKTGHVQSSVGLVIVPAFLNWFFTGKSKTLKDLQQARMGQGNVVEAHPRPFLYSAIERVYLCEPNARHDWPKVLRDVVTYKDKRQESHAEQRQATYEFLRQRSGSWLWDGFSLGNAPELLFASDHLFEAFLAALTAFARRSQQTIGWQSAGLIEDVVRDEGHILVLRPNASISGQSPSTARNSTEDTD